MTTLNGKLIATDRQELDLAKQQIAALQQQYEGLSKSVTIWDRSKEQIARDIALLQQLKSKINAIEQKNSTIDRQLKKMAVEIRSQQTYLILSILSVVFVFTGGLVWLGHTSKASPAELSDLHHYQLNSSSR
jgi:phosphate starvation-inducible protein PhoH